LKELLSEKGRAVAKTQKKFYIRINENFYINTVSGYFKKLAFLPGASANDWSAYEFSSIRIGRRRALNQFNVFRP
jgi:hypothetical protein